MACFAYGVGVDLPHAVGGGGLQDLLHRTDVGG